MLMSLSSPEKLSKCKMNIGVDIVNDKQILYLHLQLFTMNSVEKQSYKEELKEPK